TNICLNHVGDPGSSPAPTASYSFDVAAGASLYINVHEVNANQGCAAYTVTISRLPPNPCASPTATGTRTRTATPPPPTSTRTATPTGPSATPTATACLAQDSLITSGAGAIVPGTTDIGNHCDDCLTTITLPFPF